MQGFSANPWGASSRRLLIRFGSQSGVGCRCHGPANVILDFLAADDIMRVGSCPLATSGFFLRHAKNKDSCHARSHRRNRGPQEDARTPPSWPTTTRKARSRSWPTSPATASSWPAPPPRSTPTRSSSAASTSWPRRPRCSTPTSACCCPTCRPAAAWPTAARPTSSPATRRCSAPTAGEFQTVTYINSTAAVKALSDWVVTSGNAEEIIRRVPAESGNPVRARPAPGPVSPGSDRPADDPLERLLHGPRDLQRRRPAGAEEADCRRRITLAHPSARPTSASTATSSAAPRRCSSTSPTVTEPTDFLVATEANMIWQLQSKFPAAPLPSRCRASPAPATSARTWPATRWKSSATAWSSASRKSPGNLLSTEPAQFCSAAC